MFADALILLFEKVARIIEAYQPVIETYYGRGNMFSLIKNIQIECDLQAIKILNKFKEARKLNYIFRTVQSSAMLNNYSRNTGVGNLGANMGQKVNKFLFLFIMSWGTWVFFLAIHTFWKGIFNCQYFINFINIPIVKNLMVIRLLKKIYL